MNVNKEEKIVKEDQKKHEEEINEYINKIAELEKKLSEAEKLNESLLKKLNEEIKEKIENLTRDILGFWTISELNRWVRTYENGEKWVELSVNINRKSEDRALDLVNKFTKAIKKELPKYREEVKRKEKEIAGLK